MTFIKGQRAWNKGLKGFCSGEKSGMWREKPNYFAVHTYIRRYKEKPDKCEMCDRNKKLQLINKNHKYERDVNDYMYCCVSCHRKWDIKHNGYNIDRFKHSSIYNCKKNW